MTRNVKFNKYMYRIFYLYRYSKVIQCIQSGFLKLSHGQAVKTSDLDHKVAGSNPAGCLILSEPEWCFIIHTLETTALCKKPLIITLPLSYYD